MLKKVISGGQTGADQGGLEGAYSLGIATGGTAPKLYRTEAGCNPTLLRDKYGLKESPYWSYPPRTEENVKEADGTVWIGNISPGYHCTKKAVIEYKAKGVGITEYWVENLTPEQLAEWVEENQIEVLNVAGNRESTNPGIYEKTKLLIIQAFGDKS